MILALLCLINNYMQLLASDFGFARVLRTHHSVWVHFWPRVCYFMCSKECGISSRIVSLEASAVRIKDEQVLCPAVIGPECFGVDLLYCGMAHIWCFDIWVQVQYYLVTTTPSVPDFFVVVSCLLLIRYNNTCGDRRTTCAHVVITRKSQLKMIEFPGFRSQKSSNGKNSHMFSNRNWHLFPQ